MWERAVHALAADVSDALAYPTFLLLIVLYLVTTFDTLSLLLARHVSADQQFLPVTPKCHQGCELGLILLERASREKTLSQVEWQQDTCCLAVSSPGLSSVSLNLKVGQTLLRSQDSRAAKKRNVAGRKPASRGRYGGTEPALDHMGLGGGDNQA